MATSAAGWQLTLPAALEFERTLVPVLFRPWAKDLVRRAALARGARVLDLACGTGIVARETAGYLGNTGEIVGVDRSEAMLAVAQASGAPLLRSLVSWRCAPAEDLPFADGSFDTVLCQQGFQFFGDLACGTRECARVLRPGGCLAFSIWRGPERNPFGRALINALRRHAGDAMANAMRRPFSLTDIATVRAVLLEAGFDVLGSTDVERKLDIPDPAGFLQGMLNAAPFAAELSDVERDLVTRAALAELAPAEHEYGVSVPSVAWVCVACARDKSAARDGARVHP